MKTALLPNELPDDLALVVDKLLVSLATVHNRAQVQRERDIQQGVLLGLEVPSVRGRFRPRRWVA